MNIMDALSITVSSMAIVFLTLLIISMVLQSFTIIFKEDKKEETVTKTNTVKTENQAYEIDEEEKVVVALATSIMAGEGKINPNLHITKISRIK